MSRRQKQTDNHSGVGSAFIAGAAVAGVAALVYGAKKLYDFVQEESQKTCEDPQPCGSDLQAGASNYTGSDSEPKSEVRYRASASVEKSSGPTVPRVLSQPSQEQVTPLAERLNQYLKYAERSALNDPRAANLMEKLARNLTKLCAEKYDDKFPVSSVKVMPLHDQGICDSRVQIQVGVTLHSETWEMIANPDQPLSYHIVSEDNGDAYNICTKEIGERNYLVPEQFTEELMVVLIEAIGKLAGKTVQGTVQERDSTFVIDVYASSSIPVDVSFIPAIFLKNVGETVSVRPAVSPANDKPMWHESFTEQETMKLLSMDQARCCHLQCLRIMRAIAVNHPAQFSMLSDHAYKTILLRMMQDTPEDDLWQFQCLPEQFVDMLNELVFYLQAKKLPHFFRREVNLLDDVPQEVCEGIINFILHRIGKEKLHTLLVESYQA